mmetsp:Transcript_5745/g.12646  ORF Transcript_5745/g.12646 Transcript_5745/m.12646 type:complete len:220 (+) Transcript_5745:1386-2045(+)
MLVYSDAEPGLHEPESQQEEVMKKFEHLPRFEDVILVGRIHHAGHHPTKGAVQRQVCVGAEHDGHDAFECPVHVSIDVPVSVGAPPLVNDPGGVHKERPEDGVALKNHDDAFVSDLQRFQGERIEGRVQRSDSSHFVVAVAAIVAAVAKQKARQLGVRVLQGGEDGRGISQCGVGRRVCWLVMLLRKTTTDEYRARFLGEGIAAFATDLANMLSMQVAR